MCLIFVEESFSWILHSHIECVQKKLRVFSPMRRAWILFDYWFKERVYIYRRVRDIYLGVSIHALNLLTIVQATHRFLGTTYVGLTCECTRLTGTFDAFGTDFVGLVWSCMPYVSIVVCAYVANVHFFGKHVHSEPSHLNMSSLMRFPWCTFRSFYVLVDPHLHGTIPTFLTSPHTWGFPTHSDCMKFIRLITYVWSLWVPKGHPWGNITSILLIVVMYVIWGGYVSNIYV